MDSRSAPSEIEHQILLSYMNGEDAHLLRDCNDRGLSFPASVLLACAQCFLSRVSYRLEGCHQAIPGFALAKLHDCASGVPYAYLNSAGLTCRQSCASDRMSMLQ